MKKVVVFVLSLFIFNFVNAESDKALFSKCVDGDTSYFLVNENEIKVRFLAIDTPESVSTNVSEQPFGKEASDYTCNKISNANEIILEYEKNKTDKYGRTLAWVWVDGSLLQEELIKNGYGQVAYIYGKYKYTESLCKVQKYAINNLLNVWSNTSYEEGYCKNKDVENTENNIIYDNIDSANTDEKTKETLDKLDKISDKMDNVMNSPKFDNILLYIVLIGSVVSLIFKETKKKK